MFFTDRDVRLLLKRDGWQSALFLELVDSSGRVEAGSPAQAMVSFLSGASTRNLAGFHEVIYRDAWPRIDALFRDEGGRLTYEFLLAPGADLDQVRLRIAGTDRLSLDGDGNLLLSTTLGTIVDTAPQTYQIVNGRRQLLPSRFTLLGHDTIGFVVDGYDRSLPLLIDPSIVYSTFLGGSGDETARAIAVDHVGAAYIAGSTTSANFPVTPGAVDTTHRGDTDGFIAKLTPDGRAFEYVTYLGGSGRDEIKGLALDTGGNAYVTGSTASADFPVTAEAFRPTLGIPDRVPEHYEYRDGFVAKLNPQGTALIYSTFLGSNATTFPFGIAVDGAGQAYVVGESEATNLPTTANAIRTSPSEIGDRDGFLLKFNALGNGVVYGSYLGGIQYDYAAAVALDTAGYVYVAGFTASPDFVTTPGAYDRRVNPEGDSFAVKIDTMAANVSGALVYGTYLDMVPFPGLAIDPHTHAAYILGYGTVDGGLVPTPVLLKLNTAGNALEYRRQVGPERSDSRVPSVAVDDNGNVYVGGFYDDIVATAFVSLIDAQGLEASRAELEGSEDEFVHAVAADHAGFVYATGNANSANFPVTVNAPQPGFAGGESDAFVTKVSFADISTINVAEEGTGTALSTEAPSYPPSAAFDGDLSTRWSSGFSDPQWLAVDLGQRYRVDRVVLHWETAYASKYELHISDDGVNWYPLHSRPYRFGHAPQQDGGIDNHVNLNGTGRYVRMYGLERRTQWGYSLWEMQVFGTPVSTPAPPPGTVNLAAGGAVSTRIIESTQYLGPNAVDGNLQTRWSSGFSDPQWIMVDLGSSRVHVSRVVLRWEAAFGRDYQIQTSNDAINWTTVRSVVNGDAGVDDLTGLSAQGRYVRMYGTRRGTPWGYSLWELEVYGVINDGGAPPPPAGRSDIVIYAADGGSGLHGLSLVPDSTAAGGFKVSSTNSERAWLDSPPAPAGAPYAVYGFYAPEAGNYRLWMRLKAQGDSKWNDSVWVQFSNASRNGVPVYAIGSNDGLLVNLENCSGCGVQGWGWQDNSWWLNQSSLVSLPAGWQQLHVGLREDGVEFDQIVLSPVRFLTTPPGPVKNDNTIVPRTAPPESDNSSIVLYGTDASALHRFTIADDSTAAGGRKITSADEGWSSPNTVPSPADAPYAEFTFDVPEAGAYRLWLRLKGQGDSKFNESVWVQFSHATRGGPPVYRWMSSDALLVNLEDCSNCGIQGWGWQDNSWWLNQSSLVHLPAGTQQLYILVREDGVEIDQVVLSGERFIASPPGPVKNDSTVLPKTTP